jgi:hypothetical protein
MRKPDLDTLALCVLLAWLAYIVIADQRSRTAVPMPDDAERLSPTVYRTYDHKHGNCIYVFSRPNRGGIAVVPCDTTKE